MIVMRMRWDGVTKEQYDEARKRVEWEHSLPPGAQFHVVWFEHEGMNVMDVWDSADAFNTFVQTRLMPVVKGELNLPGEPKVEISPAYRVFDAKSTEVRHH
jgi:hypothetical protein